MTSTDTADTSPYESPVPPPKIIQHTSVTSDMPMTTGTKTPAMRSTIRCTGALLPCACSTIVIIRASTVSLPTPVAVIEKAPRRFIVPASTVSPAFLPAGIGSPLIMLSSTNELPLSSTPSTGILSPGRTLILSPFFMRLIGMSDSVPSAFITRAVFA